MTDDILFFASNRRVLFLLGLILGFPIQDEGGNSQDCAYPNDNLFHVHVSSCMMKINITISDLWLG